MDYQQSRAYIRDAEQYAGGAMDLTNIKELMKRLGNPQDQLKYIHVAGTNGKGSVIAYLYTTLMKAGYHVGRYISPSVYSYREKIETEGKPISREKFAEQTTRVAAVIEEMTAEGLAHPTPFEIETAVAFLFFAEEKCDPVILEVGMGGITDATNLITTTELAVLVPISMDHQSFLGNTISEIAEKKAGIIKPGSSVVTIGQETEALEVIKKTGAEAGADVCVADVSEAEVLEADFTGQRFCYKGEEYTLSLAGSYQTENAVLALEALRILDERGYHTTLEQRKEGLWATRWNGRLTIIHKDPLFIVDGAHNPAAADMLEDSVRKYFKDRRLFFIMGVFKDKDYPYIIRKLCPYAEQILAIETPDNPRALPAEELAKAIRPCNANVRAEKNIPRAVEELFEMAGKDDVILSFGSLSFIGEITRIVNTRKEVSKVSAPEGNNE
ncbi:bifunctional folylpolyglutamate synthase/dihydrofolate synthase [Blautia sp. MSK17_66]|uniref:bifunctional folylpolyglutamate synthase/dihydrofolate synthase n=1 Tax=Blautia TaxID=572511 RepID=UPI00156E07FD|nr:MULTISPECIES: folylpolyglutamate synthase/dihydrofolate synthase family protein [Blautia]MCB5550881.1 bifunctional folylpolyglutamate synthase/dihydrofolate synthase [Blautia sp. MSK17_66]NSK02400.1 bifunctional folylpolyglutamate synthase/dihydrofolate synthase [Blautia obeum]